MKDYKKVLLPVSILAGSLAVFYIFEAARPSIEEKQAVELSYLAKVQAVELADEQINIPISGVVKPAHEYNILSQVEGKVINLADNLIVGSKFNKGEFLFTLDSREYDEKLSKASADLSIAEYDLQIATGKAESGKFAWDIENSSKTKAELEELKLSKNYTLATGLVEQNKQEEVLNSSLSEVALTELDVEKTEFMAPCNGVVLTENVEHGQVLQAGSTALTYACTDYFYVTSDIISTKLGFLNFDNNKITNDVIVYSIDKSLQHNGYEGQVLNFIPSLTQTGKLSSLLIKVLNPMQYDIPLFIGSFVKGTVKGKTLYNVYKAPYQALRNNNTMWVADNQNRLKIVNVNVAFTDKDYVYIDNGLKNGERIVVSKLPTAINGLKLEITN